MDYIISIYLIHLIAVVLIIKYLNDKIVTLRSKLMDLEAKIIIYKGSKKDTKSSMSPEMIKIFGDIGKKVVDSLITPNHNSL